MIFGTLSCSLLPGYFPTKLNNSKYHNLSSSWLVNLVISEEKKKVKLEIKLDQETEKKKES